MTKNDMMDYLIKLKDTIEQSERKTYIVSTRLIRTVLLLQQYNTLLKNDALRLKICELDNYSKKNDYGNNVVFQKEIYLKILGEIFQIIEKNEI